MFMSTLLSGVTLGVAAGLTGIHASMAPRSQLFGRTIYRGRDYRCVALTYDDGPNPKHTLTLLELFEHQSVKATFFVIGRYAKTEGAILREIVKGGHVIGNHSYNHRNLLWLPRKEIDREIEDCQKAIEDSTGSSPQHFRPPFGARRPAVLQAAITRHLIPVMWTGTCFDWKGIGSDEIVRRASRDIDNKRFGSILLLHDGGHGRLGADRSETIQASKTLVTKYSAAGFRFVTVPVAVAEYHKDISHDESAGHD